MVYIYFYYPTLNLMPQSWSIVCWRVVLDTEILYQMCMGIDSVFLTWNTFSMPCPFLDISFSLTVMSETLIYLETWDWSRNLFSLMSNCTIIWNLGWECTMDTVRQGSRECWRSRQFTICVRQYRRKVIGFQYHIKQQLFDIRCDHF